MTLVYVSFCEVARGDLLQLPLHPWLSNDNFALMLQKALSLPCISKNTLISDIGQTEI